MDDFPCLLPLRANRERSIVLLDTIEPHNGRTQGAHRLGEHAHHIIRFVTHLQHTGIEQVQ